MGSTAEAFAIKEPIRFDRTPQAIQDDARTLVRNAQAAWDAVVASVPTPEAATFANTIEPIIQEENVRHETRTVLRFSASTSPHAATRDAANVAINIMNDDEVDRFSRQDVFERVDVVFRQEEEAQKQQKKQTNKTNNNNNTAQSGLDPQAAHYLRKLHQKFQLNGCSIASPAAREVFKAKKKQLQEAVREAQSNMAAEATGLWLTPDELEGVHAPFLARLQGRADKDGEDREHDGALWLPTKLPFSQPVMSNARRASTRKRVYYAVVNRMPANEPLFRQTVLLRDELARMLGYPHHAALKASLNMIGSVAALDRLLAEIKEPLQRLARRQAAEALQLKQADRRARKAEADQADQVDQADQADREADKVFFWDSLYLLKKGVDQKRSADGRLDGTAVPEYFELHTTLQRLLQLFAHLFGARLVPVDTSAAPPDTPGALTWHETVQMYAAWNVDGVDGGGETPRPPQFLGYAYLDLFTRDGKWTHAGHLSLQQGYDRPPSSSSSSPSSSSGGSRYYPSSALVMNYIRPTAGKPTLLGLDGVRKLFHEMGHMFHGLFAHARYAALHRVQGDFVETPSLMLEQFFWQPRHIRDVSWHYAHISPAMEAAWRASERDKASQENLEQPETPETPENLPPPQLSQEQAELLASSNTGQNVRTQIKELFFTTYDQRVHRPDRHEDLEALNLTELFNRTRAEIHQLHGGEALGEGWEWGHGQAVFRNVMNGYDAEYYSYILGRIFALDIFEVELKKDTMNRDAGRRYRDMVLCKGGSQPEMKTLTDYLGRAPSTKPYLDWLEAS